MKKNKTMLRAMSLALSAAMILAAFSGCGANELIKTETEPVAETETKAEPVYFTELPGSVEKSETVYVNLDSAGKPKSTVVSDWLHTDKGGVKVFDKSDLENIVNVKSEIEPVAEKGGLTWHMDSTDLYYRGSSGKKLPVSFELKYYLDGKEISADKLAGKKGDVEIKIKAVNNVSRKVKIDGKDVKIYTPFIVLGGMIMQESDFSGITAENGKVVGDGSKEIVAFIGAPGMEETLGLKDLKVSGIELKLADTFSVKARTDSFSLGNIYFAVLPLSSIASELGVPETLDELRSTLSRLGEIEKALSGIDVDRLLELLTGSGDKLKELTSLVSKAVNLYESNKVLLEILPKYLTEENVQALSKLIDDIDSSNLKEVYELLNRPVMKTFIKNLPGLAKSLMDVMPMIEQFEKDMENPALKQAMDALPETLVALGELQASLNENKELIDELTSLLSEENIGKINKLLDTADTRKTSELLSDYGELAENTKGLMGRAAAMLDKKSSYDIFSDAAEGTKTGVTFIYQTPAIA